MVLMAFPKGALSHCSVGLLLIQFAASCSSSSPNGGNTNGGTGGDSSTTRDGGAAGSDTGVFVNDLSDNSGIANLHDCAIALNGACSSNFDRDKTQICNRWNTDHPTTVAQPHTVGTPTCDPGQTSPAAIDDALRRLNLYRWLAKLSAVTLNSAWSVDATACSVIQAYLGHFDHHPDPSSQCYTDNGGAAAGVSEIATGVPSPAVAIDGLIWDCDANNARVIGHRQGMLQPGLSQVGIGYSEFGFYQSGTCLKVWEPNTSLPRPSGLAGTVLYPPAGIAPFELVSWWTLNTPHGTSREADRLQWSAFLPANATVTGATVRMYHQGATRYEPITITAGPLEQGIGIGLYWLPSVDIDPGTYVVIIDGTSLGSFGYRVQLEPCGAVLTRTCDMLAQDCGVTGSACTQWTNSFCVPTRGIAVGQPCDSIVGDCVAGAICATSTNTIDQPLCTSTCDLSSSTGAKSCNTLCPGAYFKTVDSSGQVIGGTCVPGAGGSCNALTQDCSSGKACYGTTSPICQPAGSTALGKSCQLQADCVPGATCVARQGSTNYTCEPYCDTSASTTSNACASLCPGSAWDLGDVGLCLPSN